jgi:hypothetical protein
MDKAALDAALGDGLQVVWITAPDSVEATRLSLGLD